MQSLRTVPPSPAKNIAMLLLFLAICFAAAAALGAWFNAGPIDNWYPLVRKPAWTPPNWVFAPVWTTLYLLMALAAWLVWHRAGWPAGQTALSLFFVQLALNAAWSGLFFRLHSPGIAFVEIVFLWFAIVATLWLFGRISALAAGLFAPYLLWVSFAAVLNGTIWWMNSGSSAELDFSHLFLSERRNYFGTQLNHESTKERKHERRRQKQIEWLEFSLFFPLSCLGSFVLSRFHFLCGTNVPA